MKINWRQYGFVRPAIAFILGIILIEEIDSLVKSFIIMLSITISGLVLLYIYKSTKAIIISFLILMMFAILGIVRTEGNNAKYNQKRIKTTSHNIMIYGVLKEHTKTRKRTKSVIQVDSISQSGHKAAIDSDVIIYFPKGDEQAKSYLPGTYLKVNARVSSISPPTNPNTFDYQSYLKYRGISHQVFVSDTNDYEVIGSNMMGILAQKASNTREHLLKWLSVYIQDPEKFSIVSAMLLGYKNQLAQDTYQKFTNSGAVHVLAVSGLHVGLVYGVFYWILGFWRSKRTSIKVVKYAILLFIIIAYAFLTGLSPAVVRASLMIGIYLCGRFFFTSAKAINIIGLCALIMLVYNPYYLFQASFQFSFISLTSIIIYQPLLERWVQPSNKFLKLMWSLASVAIAAQVLVFPITIYFFHKFPVLFVLTGIIAVPLAILALYLGGLLLVVHGVSLYFEPVKGISEYLGYLTNVSLDLFAGSIDWINSIPYVSANGLWMDLPMVLAVYALIGMLTLYLFNKKGKQLIGSYIIVILILGVYFLRQMIAVQQATMTIYDCNSGVLIDLFNARKGVTISSAEVSEEDEVFIAHYNRDVHGVHVFERLMLEDNAALNFQYNNSFNICFRKTYSLDDSCDLMIIDGKGTVFEMPDSSSFPIIYNSKYKANGLNDVNETKVYFVQEGAVEIDLNNEKIIQY